MGSLNPITVLHDDEDFRIVRFERIQFTEVYIQHQCPVRSKGLVGWGGMIFQVDQRGWTCGRCKHSPSDGLQAAFWFLKEAENE